MISPPSGSIFYRDDYGTLYTVEWETTDYEGVELLDFTTIIKQPYVPGEEPSGEIIDRQVFRRGVCTIQRQIFAMTEDGYVVVAEGESQTICNIQTTFRCAAGPTDPFLYHLDSYVCDEVTSVVTCGPRFTDPDEPDDDHVRFPDVAADGSVIYDPLEQPFQFVDVWANEEDLISVCEPETGTGTSP